MFAKMKYRSEDFDKITQEKLEKRLPEGPAMQLINAIQELIRSKNERGPYNISLSHAVASSYSCCLLFVVSSSDPELSWIT